VNAELASALQEEGFALLLLFTRGRGGVLLSLSSYMSTHVSFVLLTRTITVPSVGTLEGFLCHNSLILWFLGSIIHPIY